MPDVQYRIKPGDTLDAISKRYGVTLAVLSQANGITNPNRIWAGQMLKVPVTDQRPLGNTPPPTTHRVRAGETLTKIAAHYGLTVEELVHANNIRDPDNITVGQVLKLKASSGDSGKKPLPILPNKKPQDDNPKPQQQDGATGGSGNSPSGNAVMDVAFRITGVFEGARATSYQNQDKGIVSYGKHQATLASGTLGLILDKYIKQSTSSAAEQLSGYMDKVRRKDSSLRKDVGFKKALLAAGADPLMSTIQDQVFAENYWPAAERGARADGLKSPLALVMYYDTNIQGGLGTVRERTAESMKGKKFSEAAFLTEFNHQRDMRLHNLAVKATKEGEKVHASWLEASRSRVTALQELVKSGDLQLRGDNKGMLYISGRQVPGLGATAGTKPAPGAKATVEAPKNGAAQAQGIDLKKIAKNVYEAMHGGLTGLGTDEDAVYLNLAKLNHNEALIHELKSVYKRTYHVDLVKDIESEFSNGWGFGDELARALSYLKPQKAQGTGGTKTGGTKTGGGKVEDNKANGTKTGGTSTASTGTREPSGKHWVSRFMPSNKVSDLKEPFQTNVRNFLAALSTAGIKVDINTTLRPPQRSYLMFYAREIQAGNLEPDQVPAFVPQGGDAPVNIDWAHRDSSGKANLAAARKAAVAMDTAYGAADAIGKPYKSNHNGGEAIDMDFSPAWGIGKTVVDANGKSVKIGSKRHLIDVGATFKVLHWNYAGPKNKKDDPHWSKSGA